MGRLAIALFVVLVHASPAAAPQVAQTTELPADGIARLLRDVEHAIATGRSDQFRTLAVPTIRPAAVALFAESATGGPGGRAIVRERMRRPIGAGYDVVADVLVSREDQGHISTWLLVVLPDTDASGRFKIADLRELASVGGLLKLRLDTTRQFAVKNLVINAPDLILNMESGSAFVAMSPNGVTGLVLRGKGRVRFTPPDPAEQLQLRIFSNRAEFITDVDTVFMRVNASEFAERVTTGSLVPASVNPGDLSKAEEVFDQYAPLTYNLDVRALTPERWSIEPTFGSLVLEFGTSRHGWLTYTRSPADQEDITLFDRGGGHNICQYSSAARIASRGRAYSDDDGAAYDVEHYALDLAFDPARLSINGRGSLRLRITTTSVSTLTIRLAQSLAVSSVSSPELGDVLAVRVIGQNHVLIGLPTSIRRGALVRFDVAYSGRLSPQLIDREAIAVQGGAGQVQSEEDRLIITPEPRFMYSNRVQWYPQGLVSDYATADLRLTVPATYQVVASGRMVGSALSSAAVSGPDEAALVQVRTSLFVADRPVRYVSCLISRLQPLGRLVSEVPAVAPAASGGLPSPQTSVDIEVVSTQRMLGRNKQTPQRTAAILRFYAETIGEAPYPNLTLATLDDNLPGGHSPAYFVALHQALPTTPYSWSSDPVAFEGQYPNFFLAHEIAHQWWGQAVGWRNYHEQWLSEGMAQYFAVLFAASDRGPAILESLISTMRESSEPILNQGPISLGYRIGHIRNDGRAFRSIMYNKAAVVLHMLRRFVGDDAFFAGLRRFYAEQRFKKAGTEEFKAAFEAGTPLKLDRFFEQWIRGFTIPRIRLSWSNDEEGKTGVIRVEQTEGVFDFPLTVVVHFADGRSEERTLKVVGQVFEERVPLSSALRRVTVRDSLSFFKLQR